MHFHICFSFRLSSLWSSLKCYIIPHIVLLCHPASHTLITQNKVLHSQYNKVFMGSRMEMMERVCNSAQKFIILQRLPE